MIIELRTYTLRIATTRDFVARYAAEGYAVQVEHLGEPALYAVSDIGEQNQVVHAWRYNDFADRDARRAAMEADPRWLAYKRRSLADDHVQQQTTAILREVDFAALNAAIGAKA